MRRLGIIRLFAGIVERTGSVERVDARAGATRLVIRAPDYFGELPHGASVAINGACLTLCAAHDHLGEFDVVPETLRLTNLGTLKLSDTVNLERSLRVGDRIDGHFVQGHVDCLGRVERIDPSGGEWKLWVRADAAAAPLLVRKGSVTLDGVSLTIVDVQDECFSVVLIPTTLERTTLGRRAPGDAINIETDVLARLLLSRIDALLEARGIAVPPAPASPRSSAGPA